MGILIGMDEAGYGPHLGPLVVAATAWEVAEDGSGVGVQGSDGDGSFAARRSGGSVAVLNPQEVHPPRRAIRKEFTRRGEKSEIDLYRLLRNVVAKKVSLRRIAIADSKALYHPGHGLRQLERGLHAVLLSLGESFGCWSAIVNHCRADPEQHHRRHCWPNGFDCQLPVDALPDELSRLGARLARACEAACVRPLVMRARLIFPEQFNELVAYYNSKGAALSHVTVGLLREVMDAVIVDAHRSPTQTAAPPVYAVCDKHGGRNFYTSILQHHFSEHWIAPVSESHSESHYEWGEPESRVRVVFRVNGERFLPTALASMTAKYLRELAMRAFNDFWRAHLPDLRPTAGYYRDAWRFKKDIAARQRELKIDDHVLWRER
jgi:hypothetical protein